jgi:hypothetical protein
MESKKDLPKFVLIIRNDDWFGERQSRVFPGRLHVKVNEKIRFATSDTGATIKLPFSIFTGENRTTISLPKNTISEPYIVIMPQFFRERKIKNFEFFYEVSTEIGPAEGCSPPSMIIED